jgi:oligopeptide/dipeptide ABC transporter ATP-binding protein
MRQRVMIAMALICNPRLLIADEPTTALDVTIQAQILDLMKELDEKRHGASVILITHDLAVIAETCSRVIVMYGGKIQEIAEVIELFERPLHPYTKGLMHSIPHAQDKGSRLRAIPGNVPGILDLPTGCKFCTRCEQVMDRCRIEEPELHEVAPGHAVRCHLLEEGA